MLALLAVASAAQYPSWYSTPCPNSSVAMPEKSFGNGPELTDVAYGSDHERQKLDIFMSSAGSTSSPTPCYAFVHGGGWKAKGKTDIPDEHKSLRSYGYTVASIGYRLSQHAPHPAQRDDIRAGLAFLREHAAEYFIDPDRIVLVGQSAGGHLVSLVGLTQSVDDPWRVAAVINFYGPSVLVSDDIPTDESPTIQLLGCDPNINPVPGDSCYDKGIDASPITHVGASKPPILIFHGTADEAVPTASSILLQAKAVNASQDATLTVVEGAGHSVQTIFKGPGPDSDGNFGLLLKWMANRLAGCGTQPTIIVSQAELDQAVATMPIETTYPGTLAGNGGGDDGGNGLGHQQLELTLRVVGCVVGACLLLTGAIVFYCRRRSRRAAGKAQATGVQIATANAPAGAQDSV